MRSQRGQALAEQTVRHLHEDNQSAEADYLKRVKELQRAMEMHEAEADRLLHENEQTIRNLHEENQRAEAEYLEQITSLQSTLEGKQAMVEQLAQGILQLKEAHG